MKNLATVNAAYIRGSEAVIVPVTAALESNRIPGITMLGITDQQQLDVRSVIRIALRASGFEVPRKHVTLDLRVPSGCSISDLELAMAAAILAASGQIEPALLEGRVLFGGLTLEGAVTGPASAAAAQLATTRSGFELIVSRDAGTIPGHGRVSALDNLASLRNPEPFTPAKGVGDGDVVSWAGKSLDDIPGQASVKRALAVAAASGLGICLEGPDAELNRAIAERSVTLLPPMTEDERLELAGVRSAAGLDAADVLALQRPVRVIDRAMTMAGLIGGGRPVRPGEVTLAHRGVLVIDRAEEFTASQLASLKKPLMGGKVQLVRVDGAYELPSKTMVVTTARPCPCGNYGDPRSRCSCSSRSFTAYRSRLIGALAGICSISALVSPRTRAESPSEVELRGQVERARSYFTEHQLESDPMLADADAHVCYGDTVEHHRCDRRAVYLIAETIAAMDGAERISKRHMHEALCMAL